MDKISVIVPAYNCQDTIEKCINSIQNQTYKNLEIIVVNDGSTDNTAEVLKSLQDEDERIKVFSIPNGGVSHARNTGIDNSTGDYVTFVDSDDYIDKEMYETLLDLANNNSAQIAHCSYKCVDGDIVNAVGDTGKVIVQEHDEALKCLLSGRFFTGSLWNKLYERELFENVRLDETIKFNEDVLANYLLFENADKSVYTDKAYYTYFQNTDSATHSVKSNIGIEQIALVAEKMAEMSKGKPYQSEADGRFAYLSLALYRAYLLSKDPRENEKKAQAKAKLKAMKKLYSGRNKVNYVFLICFPHIYKLFYGVYTVFRTKKLDPSQE